MKIFQAIKDKFNVLPSVIKVAIYSGVSLLLGVLLLDIQGDAFNWREYAEIPVTMAINIVAYLILREKE